MTQPPRIHGEDEEDDEDDEDDEFIDEDEEEADDATPTANAAGADVKGTTAGEVEGIAKRNSDDDNDDDEFAPVLLNFSLPLPAPKKGASVVAKSGPPSTPTPKSAPLKNSNPTPTTSSTRTPSVSARVVAESKAKAAVLSSAAGRGGDARNDDPPGRSDAFGVESKGGKGEARVPFFPFFLKKISFYAPPRDLPICEPFNDGMCCGGESGF